MPPPLLQAYDLLQSKINRYLAANKPVPEHMLNGSFNLVRTFIEGK